MQDNDKIDFMADILTFWDKIGEQDQELLIENARIKNYKRGDTIHGRENECSGILLIKEGEIRICILSEEGREVTLYRLKQGEVCILSASCVLKSITFDVHIDAVADCEILLINAAAFSNLAGRNIYVENFVYKDAMARFSDVIWSLEQMLFKRFDQRLAAFLLDEISKNNSEMIMLTHEQMAKNVGSAREVVSRMLKNFAAEGLVELFRGGVRVLDKKRLWLML